MASLTGKLLQLVDDLEKEVAKENHAATLATRMRSTATSDTVKETYDRRILEHETRAAAISSVKSKIVKAVQ